jgi:hypothetical protein
MGVKKMDYKEVMDNLPQDYNTYYEQIIDSIIIDTLGQKNVEHLLQSLQEKREAGLKKYGDLSFQSSFVNSMNSPTLQHAQEELLDAMNYMAHEIYKSKLLYPDTTADMELLLRNLHNVYKHVEEIISCVK